MSLKRYIVLAHEKVFLVKKNNVYHLPHEADLLSKDIDHVFSLDQTYLCGTTEHFKDHPEGNFIPLKEAYVHLGEAAFQIIGRARQLLDWRVDHRFCGRCGELTEFFDQEKAKRCPNCGLANYPRISPCIMVAIKRKDEILLARSPHFPQGLFSVLAGFIEPGESAEDCVHREVYEEVGLKIGNIKFFASQPWPFPGQLMLGFTADYLSGEITIDGEEISEAKWFRKDSLPTLPVNFNLSYALIQKSIKN